MFRKWRSRQLEEAKLPGWRSGDCVLVYYVVIFCCFLGDYVLISLLFLVLFRWLLHPVVTRGAGTWTTRFIFLFSCFPSPIFSPLFLREARRTMWASSWSWSAGWRRSTRRLTPTMSTWWGQATGRPSYTGYSLPLALTGHSTGDIKVPPAWIKSIAGYSQWCHPWYPCNGETVLSGRPQTPCLTTTLSRQSLSFPMTLSTTTSMVTIITSMITKNN